MNKCVYNDFEYRIALARTMLKGTRNEQIMLEALEGAENCRKTALENARKALDEAFNNYKQPELW